MAQRLKAQTAFAEDLVRFPTPTAGGSQPVLTLAPGDVMPCSSLSGHLPSCVHPSLLSHTHR